jgi:hypothetical protein
MIFNPLHHLEAVSSSENPEEQMLESTSALINDTMGMCPKCKKPFGSAGVDGAQIYYCEPCRVSQPIPIE